MRRREEKEGRKIKSEVILALLIFQVNNPNTPDADEADNETGILMGSQMF